jgi:hypothetical protein
MVMSHEYGRLILRNARAFRDTKSAGLDYAVADSNATERRVDRWILWLSIACLPILAAQLWWRV